MKAQLNVKNAEVSECKIQVDDLKSQMKSETKSREELQLHYQSRLREKQAEIDSYRAYVHTSITFFLEINIILV